MTIHFEFDFLSVFALALFAIGMTVAIYVAVRKDKPTAKIIGKKGVK